MSEPIFASILAAHPWRPIRGCPGRYVLGPPTATTPAELVGTEVQCTKHRVPGARDLVVVARIERGGLISYQQADGMFIHTLGDAAGFERKLAQLGVQA